MDTGRRRYAADRGQCDAWKGRAGADRTAGRCDEGIAQAGILSVPLQTSIR